MPSRVRIPTSSKRKRVPTAGDSSHSDGRIGVTLESCDESQHSKMKDSVEEHPGWSDNSVLSVSSVSNSAF